MTPDAFDDFGDITVDPDSEFVDKSVCSTFEVGEDLLVHNSETDDIEYLKINFKMKGGKTKNEIEIQKSSQYPFSSIDVVYNDTDICFRC